MTRTLLRCVTAVAFALLAGAAPLFGQTGQIFGEIVGKVADAEGGVLPGVSVTLSGPAIMGVRSATTNETGQYRFPGINPGAYTVKFELSGFGVLVREQ